MTYYVLNESTRNFRLATALARLYSRKVGYEIFVIGVRDGTKENNII